MRPDLATLHRIVGILAVLTFLLTGQYMDRVHDHLIGMADAQRMLFRSTHLYILFTGLMNLLLGLQRRPYLDPIARRMQTVGSLLVLVLPVALTIAFFHEPFLVDFARPLTRPAAYGALGAGVLLLAAHLLAGRSEAA